MNDKLILRLHQAGSIWLVDAGEDEPLELANCERLTDSERVTLINALVGMQDDQR